MRPETIVWVGGEDDFALTLPLIRALQERSKGDGIGLIYSRLRDGIYRESDIIDSIALALEGGGMPRREARAKVENLYSDHGLGPLHTTAFAVVLSSIQGWPTEDEGTPDPAKQEEEIPESLMSMNFEDIWKTAWKLGLSQDDLDGISIAEFHSLIDAHQEYHGKKPERKPEPISAEKLEELGIGKTYQVKRDDNRS